MINIVGFLIIIFAFFVPFISGGKVPSILIFWIGFFFLLLPNKNFPKASEWLKWARMGLLLNVLGTLFLFLFGELVVNTSSLSSSYFAQIILSVSSWIFQPVSRLFEVVFPYKQVRMPNGSVLSYISFLRGVITDFFNVLIFVGFCAIFGKLVSTKQN